MWYAQSENKYIQDGTQFELDGITYPAQWLAQATLEQKEAIGLQEVVVTNSPANQAYYWVSEDLDGATLTYVNTPKDLTDVKTNAIAQTNTTAYSLLFPTDWMVVKATETSTKVPTSWNTWRAEVRATATTVVSMIEAAPDVGVVESVMANIAWPKDPDQVAAEALAVSE